MAHREEKLRRAVHRKRGTAGGSLTNRCTVGQLLEPMSQSLLSLFSVIFLGNLRRGSRARRSLARRSEPLTAGSDSLQCSNIGRKGVSRDQLPWHSNGSQSRRRF